MKASKNAFGLKNPFVNGSVWSDLTLQGDGHGFRPPPSSLLIGSLGTSYSSPSGLAVSICKLEPLLTPQILRIAQSHAGPAPCSIFLQRTYHLPSLPVYVPALSFSLTEVYTVRQEGFFSGVSTAESLKLRAVSGPIVAAP